MIIQNPELARKRFAHPSQTTYNWHDLIANARGTASAGYSAPSFGGIVDLRSGTTLDRICRPSQPLRRVSSHED